jgi:membrane protease YdiL (CAAX protease family)
VTPSAKTRGSDATPSARSEGRPKARVQAPSPRASAAKARSASRAPARSAPRARRRAEDDVEGNEIDDLDGGDDTDLHEDGADDGEIVARPTGLKALFLPVDANYVPPAERTRPWWGMGDMGLWFLVSQIAGGIAYYIAVAAGGYSLYWPVGPGARAGEVIGRTAIGQEPSITKTILDMPLELTQAIQIPLWIGFIGGPLYASRRKGTSLKEDFGFTMKWADIPIGLAIGAFAQIVILSILYKVIFIWTGEQDVSAQAREITSKATSPALTVLLVLGVAIAAPVFEELFFRGLSQRAIAKRLGPALGVVLSALFFAVAHFQTLQFPGLLAFGLILGFLAHRFGRLGPSIFAHIGFNLVAAVLLVWNVNLP